jgi:RHS repeat-associated protein
MHTVARRFFLPACFLFLLLGSLIPSSASAYNFGPHAPYFCGASGSPNWQYGTSAFGGSGGAAGCVTDISDFADVAEESEPFEGCEIESVDPAEPDGNGYIYISTTWMCEEIQTGGPDIPFGPFIVGFDYGGPFLAAACTDPVFVSASGSTCDHPGAGPLTTSQPFLAIGGGPDYTCPYCTNNAQSGVLPAEPTGDGNRGDPIRIGNGNVFEVAKDYDTAGTNDLAFRRYYNGLANPNSTPTSLGPNWRSNYDTYIRVTDSAHVTIERPDGQELQFTNNGSGWVSDTDVSYVLNGGAGNFALTCPDTTLVVYNIDNASLVLPAVIYGNTSNDGVVGGYSQSLTYNSSNQLTNVTDTLGRQLNFTYTGSLLNTVTTPDGLVLTYGFDSSGSTPGVNDRLASVSFSTSPATSISYLYENTSFPFALTGITDQNSNRYASWTYDAQGRGLSSQHGSGADLVTVTYDDVGGTRTVTNALGEEDIYHFSLLQNVPKVTEIDRQSTATTAAATKTFTYDGNGYLASRSDWNGNLTTYTNDSHGNVTSQTEASGTALARTTSFNSYISNNATTDYHLPSQIVAPGKTTNLTYDSFGRVHTRSEVDTTTQTTPYSTNGTTRTWTFTYDNPTSHLLTAQDPMGNTTTYTYDSLDNLSTVTDALGHVSHITSYNGRGLPLSMTDANSITTVMTYDTVGRLLTRTVQASSGNATTTFAYDAAGNVTSITLPDSSSLSYTYDTAHRVTKVTDSLSNTINYTLDAAGNITQQQVKDSSNTLTKTQSKVFDALSRMLQQIGAASQTTTFTYDSNGNRLTTQDPLSHTTTQAFDGLNRLLSSLDPLSHTTSFAYDAQDNLTSLTDPRTLVTSYAYDGFGRVIQETSPDKGTTTYTLDLNGNRTSETDARSVVTNRTFDALNRVTAETYPASAGENIAYSYDSTAGTNYGVGRLTGFTDQSGSTGYTYDARGNVITVAHTIAGQSYTTSYSYDLADHLASITYPSGHIITYTRDAMGRVTAIAYKASSGATPVTLASSVTYEPFGPVTGLTYGNGLTRTLGYDTDYRLTSLATSATGYPIQSLTYGYNNANNITSITDALDSTRSQTFTYDADYRLLTAASGGMYPTATYTYDADGNRASKTVSSVTDTYNYPTGSNLLSSITHSGSSRNFTYTANGNMATDDRSTNPDNSYSYNNRNRYSALTVGSTATGAYSYDALGQRVAATVSSSTNHYHYDLAQHLLADTQSTGTVNAEYVYLNDLPLAQLDSSGTITYLHPDHLNTAQKATDATKTIVNDHLQQPFGEYVSHTGTVNVKLRFPGQHFDAESGLSYNLNRDYDATIGAYPQADPIGLAGGTFGLHAYAGQNPVNAVDPDGLLADNFLGVPLSPEGAFNPGSLAHMQQNGMTPGNFPPINDPAGMMIVGGSQLGLFVINPFGGVEAGICEEAIAGTLTSAERAEIQAIADRFGAQIDVVGSRAAGQGRNIENLDFPVGKGPNTRSDIDFIVNGQDIINSRGALNDQLNRVGNGAGRLYSPSGVSEPPSIIFRPKNQ